MRKGIWREKWRVLLELSPGGQGNTFLVEPVPSSGQSRRCVVKVLRDQKTPERRARMLQEVTNLRLLNHPRVAQFVESNAEAFNEDVELYLVTEYVEGDELAVEKPIALSDAVTCIE